MQSLLAACKSLIIPYHSSFIAKRYLASLAFLLAGIIYINYYIGFPSFNSVYYKFGFDYSLYTLSFAGAYFLQYLFYADKTVFTKKWFLILLFAAPAMFAFRVNLNPIYSLWMPKEQYLIASIKYFERAAWLILLVLLVWCCNQKKDMPLYGCKKTTNMRLYIVMLVLMTPVVLMAAMQHSFSIMYPKFIFEAGLHTQSSIYKTILFELGYSFDFVSIEFFFRGFLVLAFAKYAGIRAIIPAACFYCCIHLGKPMPEAISSFFGGLVLGFITYHTKSIWGGLLVHLGIAWTMELFACLIHHSS